MSKKSSTKGFKLNKKWVRKFLNYNHLTGVFTWKHRSIKYFPSKRAWSTWNAKFAGKVAGSFLNVYNYYKPRNGAINPEYGKIRTRYWCIPLNNKKLCAHRLAFLYMLDQLVEKPLQVDHINGNGLDNRWLNLRLVSSKNNARNKKMYKNNTSGHNGVSYSKRDKRWQVRVPSDERFPNGRLKSKWVGYFDTKEEAILAREDEEQKVGVTSRHGK